MQVFRLRIDVEQAGDDLALGGVPLQERHRADPIMRVIIRIDLAQRYPGAIVLLDLLHRTWGVIDDNRLAAGDDVQPVHRIIVLAHVIEAFGRAGMVVEGDAGADHVDERCALVLDGGRDQRHQLGLVAGKASRHEARAKLKCDRHQVDGVVGIRHAALVLRAAVGGGRKLTLGEAVNAVVFDDIGHVDAAPDRMRELAEADRGRVAVAGNAEVDQIAVGEIGAGQHRWHAAMDRIEAMRIAEEIVGRFRGAADARNLGDAMRLDRKFETGLDDRGGNRIVAAAGAQRGNLALVIAVGEAEIVLRKAGMLELRLGDIGHDFTFRSGVSLS